MSRDLLPRTFGMHRHRNEKPHGGGKRCVQRYLPNHDCYQFFRAVLFTSFKIEDLEPCAV
eukprot:2592188-Amphidinium_carterae.1